MITSRRHSKRSIGQKGFTIIELMIAAGILSTILMIVTVVMISIGNLYYKGINQARVQDDTRTITDEVSDRLRLSGGSLATAVWAAQNERAYCIDNVRYTYVLGVKLGSTPPGAPSPLYKHVLWRDVNPTPGSCYIAPLEPDGVTVNPSPVNLLQSTPSPGGIELISPDSELTAFCIGALINAGGNCPYASINNASPFPLTVGVAYGDYDLLNLNGFNSTCKGGTGDRFCSTARLQTTAVQRL